MSVPFVPMGNGFNFHEAFADGRRQGADQYKDARNFFENRRQFDTQAAFQERQENNLQGYRQGTLVNDSARVELQGREVGIAERKAPHEIDQMRSVAAFNNANRDAVNAETEYEFAQGGRGRRDRNVMETNTTNANANLLSSRAAMVNARTNNSLATPVIERWGYEKEELDLQRQVRSALAEVLDGGGGFQTIGDALRGTNAFTRVALLQTPQVRALATDASALISNYGFSSPQHALQVIARIKERPFAWNRLTANQRRRLTTIEETASFAAYANSGATPSQGSDISGNVFSRSGLEQTVDFFRNLLPGKNHDDFREEAFLHNLR